jgi:hypothetical protein
MVPPGVSLHPARFRDFNNAVSYDLARSASPEGGFLHFHESIVIAFVASPNGPGHDIPKRFSFGGAAHGPYRIDSAFGIRAGERKTGWTKALPRSSALWALNAAGSVVGLRLGRLEQGSGAICGSRRASDQSARSRIGQLALAPARQPPSRREPSRPDLAGVSSSRGRNIDAVS